MLLWSISGVFNYNIFGVPFSGADICGFHDSAIDELCVRWHILGLFYPFSRNHNVDTGLSQEPWSFGYLPPYLTPGHQPGILNPTAVPVVSVVEQTIAVV